MRSRPYKPPPPIPLLDDIAAMIPRPKPTASPSNHIALDTLDHETSRLIPPKRRTHHVWVQGRLAAVRTVSTASLSSASRRDCGVSGTTARRHSLGSSGDDHDERETALREKQMRGYGIGGLGNIRESLCATRPCCNLVYMYSLPFQAVPPRSSTGLIRVGRRVAQTRLRSVIQSVARGRGPRSKRGRCATCSP